ncbi:hypothetical protein Celaphus_00001022, partial [Cervus elaphus hippelaphus]
MANDDSFFYLGTTTGDILKMNPRTKLLADTGPAKDKFSLMGGLLVGSGDGLLVFCKSPSYKPIKSLVESICKIFGPAWDDGRIRAFAPETGRLMYVINNAHRIGVTAIATTSDCKRIISGGGEGEVRVWHIGHQTQKLEEALKEHKSSVSCIRVKKSNEECVTASTDGTCIIWDLVRLRRNQMILANTLFQCVCYHPEEFQIITSGTDRKIAYWEVFDGSVIRELDGSLSGAVNGMDITVEGVHFVTGGNDHLVKVWDYNEGEVTHVGVGHSGNITRIRISPGNQYIVSVSADGAIL